MPNRSRWSWIAGAALLALAGAPRAAGSDVLAEAGFDADPPGSQVPFLSEPVSDCSSTTGGLSQVETHSGGQRYRLNDVGTQGGSRGIALVLAESVISGTLVVSADLVAAQVDREGGELCVSETNEGGWCVKGGFGADGNLRLHGQATEFAYEAGATYRLTATVSIAANATSVDYQVVNLGDPEDSFSLQDQAVGGLVTASRLTFRTGFEDDGSWAIDGIEVVRQ
jgi:hypothetical protein